MKSAIQNQSAEVEVKAKSRTASVTRETKETKISIRVDLDTPGEVDIKTSLPFLSHMLGGSGPCTDDSV